jgi:MFS family permease
VGLIEPVGYIQLVRQNRNFRRLWAGNNISLIGDWFNFIALINVVSSLTGSPFALGLIFIVKMLPMAVASPFAGLLVDRFDRRWLMILSDLIRAVLVAGLILAERAESPLLLYTLITGQVVVSAVFHPAQTASIPNITSPGELLTANALMAASWSAMLAFGAAIGGLVTSLLGSEAVFAIDSLTYVVSAVFIFGTVIPQRTEARPTGSVLRTATRDIIDGVRYLLAHPPVSRISMAKAVWAIAGGGLVYMLALVGERIDPDAPDVALGVLFAARGLGTGIGPIVARRVLVDRTAWPMVLGACVLFSGLCYAGFAQLPWSYWMCLLVLVSHASSGANWVLATVLMQERTEDRFRGRVFSTEWLLVMLADTVSILTASLVLEAGLVDLRMNLFIFAIVQISCGLAWMVFVAPRERHETVEGVATGG